MAKVGKQSVGESMVEFTEDFRERMRKKLLLLKEADSRKVRSNVKVTVVKHDNQLSEAASRGGFKWKADENGPSPLDYFVSSLAVDVKTSFTTKPHAGAAAAC